MMTRILFAAFLAALAGTAAAGPLVFTDVTLSASALAIAGSAVDSDSDGTTTSTSASVPADASASESGASASGAAASTFDAGTGSATLLAQASAQGGGASGPTEVEASALSSASFLGQFDAPGATFVFTFDFSGAPTADGDATSDAKAHVLLLSGTDTLIDEVLQGIMQLSRTVVLPIGLPGLLSIEVTGSANAVGPFEGATGAAILAFSANRVPEPAGWMLVLLALAVAFLMAPPAVAARRSRSTSTE